ncbi:MULTISPECIES: putative bifunctional diguanylate cyclase/phosphodiesterase [Marinobacter]|uniref:EAL domain-containing protein n=1 Tax=Marinobacter xiaoshiensis TaxID=3073652 RepID=A0ABU2HDT8_9GAMM|nr:MULTISPECIES: GGDEF and EAL domain-containing protein [unclassified Marinobacter]MBK1887200.1 EAL domain-containing protein [Marinobacter sp. DY40_1A1]MDS1308771.1 EAL domain-containing protein [Marinobacter sp. F60267]
MPNIKDPVDKVPTPKVDPKRLSLVASASRNMVLILDAAGTIEWANPVFEEYTGHLLQNITGIRPSELLKGPATDTTALTRIARELHRVKQFEEEVLLYTRAGEPFWVHAYGLPIGDEQGVAPGFIVIMNNISDHKHSERGLRIAASVFDRSHEAIIISDQNNRILDVNPSFSRITGYSRADVLGLNPSILSSGRHSPAYYRAMWQSIEESGHWRGEIWNRRKNGEEFVELQSISRIHLDEPGSYYHVANFTDITELKNHAKDIDRAANYDDLTGLPNLQLLKERLHHAQIQADIHQKSLSVGYIDLDGFKAINENFGAEAGDKILCILASRLAQGLRSGDTVARIGGDEFGLILQSDNHDAIYDRILSSINEPVDLGGEAGSIVVTASLGITRYPEDNADAEGLIRHADQAVYAAKDKGRNLLHVFDPEQNEHRQQRRAQLIELSRALENKEFELHFQPQVRIADCKVIGFEALIRWNHPHKGLLYPDAFLPSLEASHLEVPLGQWVLEEAVFQMGLWHDAGEDLSVSINISARHMMDWSFTSYLENYLQCHPAIKPEQITLEVLESTSLEDIKRASDVLARCQELGFRVALDDFGTGFSSLSYLNTLPIDLVKVDKSFVINMLNDSNDRAIVESVIFMGQRFSHPILAEGVETFDHARALSDLGCEYMQGYGVGRPMPAGNVLEWTQQWRKSHPASSEAAQPAGW